MKDNLGYVHVYCGDGKGKTTTAMGLCTRAAGYGYKVLIYQFMKNNKTSERKILQQIPNITFVDGLEQEKFSFQMTISEKLERKTYYEKQFRKITAKAAEENYDLLFFDELIYTIRAGLFDEQILLDYLKKKDINRYRALIEKLGLRRGCNKCIVRIAEQKMRKSLCFVWSVEPD